VQAYPLSQDLSEVATEFRAGITIMTPQEIEQIGRIVEVKLEAIISRLMAGQAIPPQPPVVENDFTRAKRAALEARERGLERRRQRQAVQG
jgi:hypothetical protein